MKKITTSFFLFLFCTLFSFSQGTISTSPSVLNADEQGKITFQATAASPLYNYSGEVYAHIGVVQSDWLLVPADWEVNLDKCKMVNEGNNIWSLTLSPSVRQWFGADQAGIPVTKIGLVIRNSDGTKKGLADDYFLTVTDNSFNLNPSVEYEARPSGTIEGINIINNSTVTFVLPDKNKNGGHKDFAYLLGDFNNWRMDSANLMKYDNATGSWWYTVSGLDAQTEYAFQYCVGKGNDICRIGDAYCEKILDPSNDKYIPASTYPGLKSYPEGKTVGIVSVFKTTKEAYNWAYPDFTGVDKDNLIIYEMLLRDFTDSGDINGALEKLNYLKALGVNAIELMPCQEFSGNDSWGYNPIYYFAMDKAYGTTNMYKQFIDECHKRGMAVILDVVYNQADKDMPFVKMYFDGSNPSSDNPWFNVSAPHPYSVFYDFNHESEQTKAFVSRNLQFLLTEYKIDGFRFDLTKGFTNRPSTENSAGNYDESRINILKGYNAAIKSVKQNAYVILEHFCATSEENELSKDGMMVWRNMNGAFCNSAKGTPADFSGLYADGNSMQKSSLVGFMESHDEERTAYVSTFALTPRMKHFACHAAFFLTVPGPKMIWQFGEMGYDISINVGGRTGKKPTHWEYLDNSKRKGLHDAYAKLLALRKAYPDLFSSSATLDWQVGTGNWNNRYMRLSNGSQCIVIAANFSNSASSASYTFPSAGTWYDFMDGGSITASTYQNIPLPAHEYKVYTNFDAATGIDGTVSDQKEPLRLYPNPATDVVYINSDEVSSVSVYTLSGILVKQVMDTNVMNVNDLTAGTYLVRVATPKSIQTIKLVRE